MTTDRYTKAVLTVIAGCLLWMCAMGTGLSLSAQPATGVIQNATVQPVIVVGTGTLDQRGTVTFNYVRPAQGPPRTDPTLPVTLPYNNANPLPAHVVDMGGPPLQVGIAQVKNPEKWDPIRVHVEPAGLSARPGIGGR